MITAIINLGLKSVRAIIFDNNGIALCSNMEPVTTIINKAWVEQDPNEWIEKAKNVFIKSLDQIGENLLIEKISFTTSASCLVFINREGTPLRNAIMVSDKRASKECVTLWAMNEFQEIYKSNSIKPTPDLYIPKILWVLHNERQIYNDCWKMVSPADYLAYKFGSLLRSDPYSATKFHYNIEIKSYPKVLLEKLNIDFHKLPSVAEIGADIGAVNAKFIAHPKLSPNAKIILSTYDALCSVIGSGATRVGDVCDVSGTVTSVRLVNDKKVNDPLSRVSTQEWFDNWLIGGSNNLGGGLIEWVKQLFFEENNEAVYQRMEKEASSVRIGAEGLLFLPYLLGERAPLWNQSARGVFFGLERKHRREHMIRAVFESTAFASFQIMEVMKGLGMNINKLYVSGGLAQLDIISQIKADIFNVPVVVQDNYESTALGSYMLTSMSREQISRGTIDIRIYGNRKTFYPDSNAHIIYSQMYDLYKSLYQNLEGLFLKRESLYDSLDNIQNNYNDEVLQNL